MRKENKKMRAVVLSAVCVLTAAGMDGSISVASTETRQTDSIEKTQTISSALASALEQIPEVAAVAVSTQEWHQKAVSNVDGETDVLLAGEEGSEVVGKLYHNTIVDVEEKEVVWTRVSADEVNGYVKSDSLAFGTDAVRRADQVCPVVEKPMEDNGAIVRTRESEPAKTLAQIEEEQREAAQAAEEARKAEEAKKKAEEEAAAAQAQQQAQEAQASQQAVTAATSGEQALLAALIFCEAGGEPYEGQVAVGAVVMNRVRSGIFPNSITEVIYQSGQFGPAITGKLDAVLADGRTTASCYQAAADALAGANPIGEALYFGNGDYGQLIGNHWFH